MSAGRAGFAPKRRINRWLRREQRDRRTAGVASRQEPGYSSPKMSGWAGHMGDVAYSGKYVRISKYITKYGALKHTSVCA